MRAEAVRSAAELLPILPAWLKDEDPAVVNRVLRRLVRHFVLDDDGVSIAF